MNTARSTLTRCFALAGAGALALALSAAPAANADPDNSNTFPLDLTCSDGHHYQVTVMSTAPDSAAVHVVTSTSVLVPTAFQWHMSVTDAGGTVLDESDSAETVHGSSARRLDTVECTFSQFAHHDWPDVGPVTIEVDGIVTAYLPH